MTFPDGDSYVGDWDSGNMNGWGAFYWNNGNSYQVSPQFLRAGRGVMAGLTQGRVRDGVMEGQGLHYRWGDGSKFVCEEKRDCLAGGKIVVGVGRFRSVNRGPKDETVSEKEFSDGWYVGQTSRGKFRKGKGTFYFLNGDRYVGDWNRDKMDGTGTYHYRNGDR